MKHIIFAGGTGKRFWPASRKKSPKQFLPVIDSQPLIKLKYDYLRRGYKPEDIYLSTGIQYEKEVREILTELPEENFIFEPAMRDTGPAVAYAVAYVEQKHPNAIVSTQWSDHYIKKPDVFVQALQAAEKIARDENKAVVVGERPRFATPHLGYIRYGQRLQNLTGNGDQVALHKFARFIEKPTQQVAHDYIQAGDYCWNLGYFVAPINKIWEKYQRFAPKTYRVIQNIAATNFANNTQAEFTTLDKISFDYIFAENLTPNETVVITTKMGWHDVGAWIQLKETLEETTTDVVTKGSVADLNSNDALIYNYDDEKLVATIGLEKMIVVNTQDVVAIFPKEDNAKIKPLLKSFEDTDLEGYL